MRRKLLVLLLCISPTLTFAQTSKYHRGVVVKMSTKECSNQHDLMAHLSGNAPDASSRSCPEYTLVADQVVYMMVGKKSKQFIPLAEVIEFRFQNNEIVVRVDDQLRETRFLIKEMVLRHEWDDEQIEEVISARNRPKLPSAAGGTQ